jgi:hypothetical protein
MYLIIGLLLLLFALMIYYSITRQLFDINNDPDPCREPIPEPTPPGPDICTPAITENAQLKNCFGTCCPFYDKTTKKWNAVTPFVKCNECNTAVGSIQPSDYAKCFPTCSTPVQMALY